MARALDIVFGALVLALALFFLFWRMHLGVRIAIVLGLTAAALLMVLYAGFSRYRLEKYITKELAALKKRMRTGKLTLLSDDSFQEICQEIFAAHGAVGGEETLGEPIFRARLVLLRFSKPSENPVGVQQILLLHRKLKKLDAKKALVLSPSPYQEEADAMSRRLQAEISCSGKRNSRSGKPAHRPVRGGTAKALDAKVARPVRENPKHSFLRKEKAKAYLLLGVFLLCWYALTGFSVLYPIIAALCFWSLAFLLSLRQAQGHREIMSKTCSNAARFYFATF